MTTTNPKECFLRLLKYLLRNKSRLFLSIIISIPAGSADGCIAYAIKPALDNILISKNQSLLILLPIGVLLMFFLTGICRYVEVYFSRYVVQKVLQDIRQDMYSKFQRLAISFHDVNPSGHLISRLTNDTMLLEAISTDVLQIFVSRGISAIVLTGVIFYQNWQLALVSILVTSIIIYPISILSKKIRRYTHEMQSSLSELTNVLTENLQGMKVIHAYNLQDIQAARFNKENDQYFKKYLKMVSAFALLPGIMQFIGAMGIAFIIWFGGYSVISDTMTTGALVSFIVAFLLLYTPVKTMGRAWADINKGLAAAQRIFNILDIDQEVIEIPNAEELSNISSPIIFKNVSFAYNTSEIIKGINIEVNTGEIVAIVGPSGSGKSTLVNLIPRFYDVSNGSITINGKDIKSYTLKSLRSKIAVVSQDTFLFDGSIYENIAIGNLNASNEEIMHAAKKAYVDSFASKLEHGFNTRVGERGVMLSGGEKQRISIARALLKDAPILILDEATSALDNESEAIVQEAISNLIEKRTVFVIAHRLSTIKNASRIVVLDRGEIVEIGSHNELMSQDSIYQKLYKLQFSL